MQDHAKQKYICGHLSLIRSLALDIPSGVTTVRDCQNLGASEKNRDFWSVLFRAPLFLGKWYGVATYFSLYKKEKKKY